MSMDARRFTKIGGLAGVALFAAFGLFLVGKGIGNLHKAVASVNWPTAFATVERSTPVTSTSTNQRDRVSSTTYSADLVFRYRVNGVAYSTGLRHFGQTEGSTDSSEAALLVLRYPEGARVPVYYDPANPAMAVAEPGYQAELLWLPGAGFFLAFPALMFAALLFGDSNPGMFDLGIAMFGAIFLSLGLIGFGYGVVQIARADASRDWPHTAGEIVYGKVDTAQSVTKDDDNVTTRSTTFGARLVYRYQVDGRTFVSNQRRFGQLAGADQEWAEQIARKYPQGSQFPVFYSPANPQLAVLEPGYSSEALWLPGAGLASLLFGLAVVVFARRALAG